MMDKEMSGMKTDKKVKRRDFLRALGVTAGAAVAASGSLVENAAAEPESDEQKRKARYQANSPEVQEYYRVNRYPTK
jgi:nitrous oxide reductase